MAKEKRPVATLDIETDPFLYGRVPAPFAIGFYDGETYVDFWGDDCIEHMMDHLASLDEAFIIYVHNGGGFDFWYLQSYITNPLFFIHRRIAKCGLMNKHELRDSYKMIPVPLAAYEKTTIDYTTFEWPTRNKPAHKKEIRSYLRDDCVYLYELVTDFISRHGMHLTQAGAAFSALKKLHPQTNTQKYYDALFRPYYYGGRNQCFIAGQLDIDYKIYDVNSMYPYVMTAYKHPLGNHYKIKRTLHDTRVSFVHCIVESNGALPVMGKKGLTFPTGTFEFHACSHELHMALDLQLIRIKRIIESREFEESQRFTEFVDKYSRLKIDCDKTGDKGGRLFAKLLLNSAYGKFGQNPERYTDCELFDSLDEMKEAGFSLSAEFGEHLIGKRPAEIKPWSYNNVAIAASITSAARAELLKGLAHSVSPLYCDTDSIICKSLDMELHDTKLGAWKCEGAGDTIYIAGKKLYACFDKGKPLVIGGHEKRASKGVQLDASKIRAIALGATLKCPIDAPVLRAGQTAKFITRNIRSTGIASMTQ